MNKSAYRHPAIKVVDLHVHHAILEDSIPINNEEKRKLSDAESKGFWHNNSFWDKTIYDE